MAKVDIYIKVDDGELEHCEVVNADRDAVVDFLQGRLEEDFSRCEECNEWFSDMDIAKIDDDVYLVLCSECARQHHY
jgi:hypothetical protein